MVEDPEVVVVELMVTVAFALLTVVGVCVLELVVRRTCGGVVVGCVTGTGGLFIACLNLDSITLALSKNPRLSV